jgi:hypothetical protein
MSPTKSLAVSLMFLCFTANAQAQQTVVAPSRSTDWSRAGVSGGIPSRPTICQTLNPGATAAQIRTALNACPEGQTVFLSAGTYSIGALSINAKNNVTLRGAGANLTILNFTGTTSCSGPAAAICVGAQWIDVDGAPQGSANWTAGYAVGTTVITLANVTGLQVGDQIILDRTNDAADTGQVFIACSSTFTDEGGCSPSENRNRGQNHHAIVQAINGTNVTIDPPIRMPNWSSANSPQAIWSAQRPRTGIGIEDLSVDLTNTSQDSAGIMFMGAVNSWAKGVRLDDAGRAHIRFYQSSRITVRDSYLFDGQTIHSTSYGFEPYGVSDCLIENNIIDKRTSPFSISGPGSGCVIAYNYVRNQPWDSPTNYQPGTILFHEAGISHYLLEGNDIATVWHDDIHGTTQFHTFFRNFIGGDPAKGSNTQIMQVNSYGRFFNVVGNVLGRSGYYNSYASGSGTSIYDLGGSPGTPVPNDPIVASSMFRWGNYDTVTAATRWCTSATAPCSGSEVPSGSANYPQPVPSTQALPASFYLPGKPAWFKSLAFPPVGPDVTGGNIAGYAGHAHKIPARVCYESTVKDGNGGMPSFNAATCYAGGGSQAPSVPTGLRITN